jgi:SSS family transporter
VHSQVTALDYLVVVLYLVLSVVVGLRSSRRQDTADDYFLGGRRQPWFPVAISIISAELSAVSYMGVPGWIYEKDLSYFMLTFLLPVVIYVIIRLFIPIYRGLRLVSVYEYLEGRYNVYVRGFAAFLFVLLRGGHMATAIYVPSLALQEIAGIPLIPSVVIMGTAVTAYTLKGGMRAVIWTDFMQFFVLVGGAMAVLLVAVGALGWDLANIWGAAAPHTRMFNFSFDLREEITFWGLSAYLVVYYITTYATDQMITQRYFTTSSEAETRRAMVGSALLTLPVVALLMAVGVALVAYYRLHPGLAETLPSPDRILPHFAVNVLPAGARGLLLAGILAATMSTISAGLNSLAAVITEDFLVRSRSGEHPETSVGQAKWTTLVCGAALTVAALYVNQLGTVLAIVGKLGGFFMGPICALFVLGVTTKRANSGGVIIGGLLGLGATMWVATYTDVSWLWWIVVGFLISAAGGWLSSWAFPPPRNRSSARGGARRWV